MHDSNTLKTGLGRAGIAFVLLMIGPVEAQDDCAAGQFGAYDGSGATRPECWAEGVLKPDGHTVSVSDAFFVAHSLGLVTTRLGEVQELERSGVRTADGDDLSDVSAIRAYYEGLDASGKGSLLWRLANQSVLADVIGEMHGAGYVDIDLGAFESVRERIIVQPENALE